MVNGQARSSPPLSCAVGARLDDDTMNDTINEAVNDDDGLWRSRVRHDIRHELGTIIMLASAVSTADDIGDSSRARIDALLGETRWLDHLIQQLDDDRTPPGPERIQIGELVGEVVAGLRLATDRRVTYTGRDAWAHIDAVALWRAVRNVLDNACRSAGGAVHVSVLAEDGRVVVQIDDDGPGFGAAPGGLSSLGLGIVHDLVAGYGGGLEIRKCELGGARVRILLPAA